MNKDIEIHTYAVDKHWDSDISSLETTRRPIALRECTTYIYYNFKIAEVP